MTEKTDMASAHRRLHSPNKKTQARALALIKAYKWNRAQQRYALENGKNQK
ncbi:putative metal homeostasis protein [Schleiferilactobacillus perolens]|uniref:putative metal homeostasis protein n=1 Tax=Schleiferilactobacillus perolens TaxID=100468 RepID=UPI000A4D6323